MDIVQLVLIRAVERVLAALIGGFSIYLGYRLFIAMPRQTDSSGKLVLPGNISIYLSRVGPGVFFSLFGAAVVSLSIYRGGLQIDTSAAENMTGKSANVNVIYGNDLHTGESDAARLASRRADVRVRIAELNKVPSGLAADFPENRVTDVRLAITAAKLALLETVWAKDWGDFAIFRNWVVVDGEPDPIPPGIKPEVIEIFQATRR